jgi:hypothetical protein
MKHSGRRLASLMFSSLDEFTDVRLGDVFGTNGPGRKVDIRGVLPQVAGDK